MYSMVTAVSNCHASKWLKSNILGILTIKADEADTYYFKSLNPQYDHISKYSIVYQIKNCFLIKKKIRIKKKNKHKVIQPCILYRGLVIRRSIKMCYFSTFYLDVGINSFSREPRKWYRRYEDPLNSV